MPLRTSLAVGGALSALAAYNRFVIYKLVPKEGRPGKFDKKPWNVDTNRAHGLTDESIQMSAETALAIAESLGPPFGVGFVFNEADGFWFIDIDNALMPDGSWSLLAQEIMNALSCCAMEVSVSGTGIHIFGRGPIPEHSCKNIPWGLEFYHHDRFVALTGERAVGNASFTGGSALATIVENYFPAGADGGKFDMSKWTDLDTDPATDTELIVKAMKSPKFASLWRGEVEPGSDMSSVDQSFANAIVRHTGDDCARALRIMQSSGLVRPKWSEHKTYLQRTILKAMALLPSPAESYGFGQDSPMPAGASLTPIAKPAPITAAVAATMTPYSVPNGVTLQDANFEDIEVMEWIWEGFLARGCFELIGGQTERGKSTICFKMIATISSGGVWPDGTNAEQATCFVWSSEDAWKNTILPRLKVMGANPAFVKNIAAVGAEEFDPAIHIPQLLHTLRSWPGRIGLLVIDPIANVIKGDSHKATEVRRELKALVDLTFEMGIATIGVTHFAKGSGKSDPSERIIGSQAFQAYARVVLCCAKWRDDEGSWKNILLRIKGNVVDPKAVATGYEFHIESAQLEVKDRTISVANVVWDDRVDGDARGILADCETREEGEEGGKIDEAVDFLTALLVPDAKFSSDVYQQSEAAGFPKRTIERAKKKAKVQSARDPANGRWSWYIKRPGASKFAAEPAFAHLQAQANEQQLRALQTNIEGA